MPYLDKVLLGNLEPFSQEIIISEDIDTFLQKEGFVQDYIRPKPIFKRIVIGSKLRVQLWFLINSETCTCYVDNVPMHDFRFNKDDYQNFISHYTHLIDKMAEYYRI